MTTSNKTSHSISMENIYLSFFVNGNLHMLISISTEQFL